MVFLPCVYLPRRATREWKQPMKEKCVTVNKAERDQGSEECFDLRHGDAELGVYPAGFQSGFGLVFPNCSLSFHLEW